MTKRQHARTQKYVNTLLPQLGLNGWVVDVAEDVLPEDDDAIGVVLKHYARKEALVCFRQDFFESTPEFQRHVTVHELLHCVWAAPECYIYDLLPKHLPAKQGALVSDTFRQHQEYSIDGLAVAIAPLLPLPTL